MPGHKGQARMPVTDISFEFFPPKTAEGDRALFEKTLPALFTLKPGDEALLPELEALVARAFDAYVQTPPDGDD